MSEEQRITTIARHGPATTVPAGTLLTITTDRREQNLAGVFRLLRDISQDHIEDLARVVREESTPGDKNLRIIEKMLDLKMIERVVTSHLMIDSSSTRPALLLP